MPSKQQLLQHLTALANEGLLAAVAWHVLIASVLVALWVGWRPTKRSAARLLIVPLLSVSSAAATYGNVFNAFVIGTSALALPRFLPGFSGLRSACGTRHFLAGHSPAIYLVAAPVGLLPCPTPSAVAGFALLSGGFHSRAWSTVLAGLALFYGVFGAFRLDVWLDLALAAVALTLLGSAWISHRIFTAKVHTPPSAS